jgi:hypothetical protein
MRRRSWARTSAVRNDLRIGELSNISRASRACRRQEQAFTTQPLPANIEFMSQSLTITVPDPLLNRLNRLAQAAQRPIEDMVLSTLAESIPEPPGGLPADIRDELAALETLSDNDLLHVATASRAHGELSDIPYSPGDETDRLALRKAYAIVLLKWRGHSTDEIHELMG